MSVMHGPRKGKKYRKKQYEMFAKFAIALLVMVVLCTIAFLVEGAPA